MIVPGLDRATGAGSTADRVERRANETIDRLSEALLSLYRYRSRIGTVGNRAVMLYLDAQESLPTQPHKALRLAREGLELSEALFHQTGETGKGHHVQPAGDRSLSSGNTEDLRERRIVSGTTHRLLDLLYDAGVRLTLSPGKPPKLRTTGKPLRLLPARLIQEFLSSREQLSELTVWDAAEAQSLLAEAHEFVADRWRPGVREPAGAPQAWEAILNAAAAEDMGGLRVALRKWVVAYVEEISRVSIPDSGWIDSVHSDVTRDVTRGTTVAQAPQTVEIYPPEEAI